MILTYNEGLHLARALKHIAPFAKNVFVIDSFSTDETVAIAKAHGAQVIENKFVNYAKQFQWALDHAPITDEWVMRLDADEVIECDLAAEIEEKLGSLPTDITGINLKRKHIFLGRWIKHGGRFPLTLLRIWRHGKARIEDRWMDEHMVLTDGRAVTFDGGFADHNLNNLTFFTEKHNKYATREAIDVLNQRHDLFARDRDLDAKTTSRQAALKRFLKEKLYNKIPYEISTIAYFFFRYVCQLGFLDGREGFAYHFLQGYWYRFLVGAKIRELEGEISGLRGRNEVVAELTRLTGHKLE